MERAKRDQRPSIKSNSGQVIKSYLPYIVTNTQNNYTQPDTSKPNTQYQYDSLGRISQITAPDGTTTQTSYNQWTLTVTDANGNQLTKIQDAYGRIKQIKEFNGTETYTTNYTYNSLGSLIQTQDQLGNTVQIQYDSLGRKTQTTDPDMGIWTYSYDANGNLISQTDAKGQTINFSYDSLNRLSAKRYALSANDVTYTYDDPSQNYTVGKLTKVQDNSSQTTFQYDNLGREISTTKQIDATNYTIQRTYDGVNRLTGLTYPDGETVNYTYNNRSQIEAIASTQTTYLQNADYNQNDQLTQITLGNGTTTHYTYNDQTKLLSNLITTDKTAAQIQNLTYSFDNIGNILGIADSVHSASQTYTYDNLSRLTSAIVGEGLVPARYYSYDATGNILSKDGINYSYNSTRPHAVTDLSDGSAYTYDANGNMQTRHTPQIDLQYLNYNSENRLINIQDAFQNTICSFVYDGDGGRIKKITPASTTTYIGSLYEITDGTITKHIFKGSTRLASKTGTSITYFHGDHLGSSNLLTDENGLEIKRIEYEPFGTSYISEGSGDTNYRYTGKELDQATGLYYYGARYYDAKLGRFITPDSIVQAPYDPQTLNRYSYCRNNPLRYTDPSGHSWKKFWHNVGDFFEKAWDVIAKPVIAVATVVAAAVITGGPGAIAVAATWIAASAAASATAVLNTGEGRQFLRRFANEVFDDGFGMSPSAAYVASSVVSNIALTWGFEKIGANLFLKSGGGVRTVTGEEIEKSTGAGRNLRDMAKQGVEVRTLGETGFQFAGGPASGIPLVDKLNVALGDVPILRSLVPNHFASTGQDWNSYNKWFHFTLKGSCVNEANAAAANAGLSWTASSYMPGNVWTTGMEMIYGVYGNQLPNRIMQYAAARSKYDN